MRIEAYALLRLLSEREGAKLFLAQTDEGKRCAIKLQRSKEPSQLAAWVKRDAWLHDLSRQAGLLEIQARGTTEDGWAWKALALADNLPSLPGLDEAGGVDQYTPLTLGAWPAIHGLPSAKQVAHWGMRLADALRALHRAGIVHRDVKPANILFVSGEPCLGDYELAGPPGETLDHRGTEGYRPVEGTNDAGADLFALGKTLYEAWTGRNRLEFPSLPKSILQHPEWEKAGRLLNEVICQACDVQPRKRFRSAEEFSAALSNVVSLRRPVSRRRWCIAVTSGSVVGLAAILTWKYSRAPARAIWRCVRSKGFNVELWVGGFWSADWERGKMYSFANGLGLENQVFQALDLRDLTVVTKHLPPGRITADCCFLVHPQTREFWLMEGGNGRVFSLHPETHELRLVGGGPHDERHYGAFVYWNPITRRVGLWGGYGQLRVASSRFEFDPEAKAWIRLAEDGAADSPCRRAQKMPLVPDLSGERIFMVGGVGSPSGVQGDRAPGWRAFDGRFHALDDIWELNLATHQWRCLLPLGHLRPLQLRVAAYFPRVKGLVTIEAVPLSEQQGLHAQAWLFRPGMDDQPILLPAVGAVPHLYDVWAYAMDPVTQELLVLAANGVFRLAINPA